MKSIETNMAPEAIGPYSQAIVASGLVFVSGQLPLDPQTQSLIEGSIANKTQQAIANIKEILKAAGTSLDNVVKTSCYLTNLEDFAAFNEEYARHFTSNPARECVQVAQLPKGATLEISVIATV